MKTKIDMMYRKPSAFESLLVETDYWSRHNHMCSRGNASYEVWFMGNYLGDAKREWDYFGRGYDELQINWS